MAKTYEDAGVNLEAGYEVVRRIKQHVASTARTGSMGNIGSFGGMFDLSALGIKEPVLVSGTDGVGTYEDFAKYDAVNRSTTTASGASAPAGSVGRQQQTAAPVVTGRTWREAVPVCW